MKVEYISSTTYTIKGRTYKKGDIVKDGEYLFNKYPKLFKEIEKKVVGKKKKSKLAKSYRNS